MNIIGYHLINKKIVCSDGTTQEQSPYIDFIINKGTGSINICYHLDFFVSCALKLVKLSNQNLLKLYETSELKLSGYKFKYVPKKFFSIEKEDKFIVMADASQYMERWDLVGDPLEKAKEACKLGGQVYNALSKLGLHPKTLVSPISAFDKEIFSKLDLPDFSDIPPEASEYAYNCCHGPWVSAFQTGHWGSGVYDYDIVSAYPFELTKCIDTRLGTWIKTDKWEPDAFYGYARGIVNITSDFSPIIYSKTNEMSYNPKGEWETFLNKKEIEFIRKYNIGDFQLDEAWWFFPDKIVYPLKKIIEWLYTKKETSKGMERKIIKRIMCFSPDTDIYTSTGIHKITDVNIGDLVYSINPSTMKIEMKPITNIYKYEYKGKLYHTVNKKHDFLITPEHKFLVKDDSWKTYRFLTMEDISKRGNHVLHFPRYAPIEGVLQERVSLWDYVKQEDTIILKTHRHCRKMTRNLRIRLNLRYTGGHNGSFQTTRKYITTDPQLLEQALDCSIYLKNNATRAGHRLRWYFNMNDFLELMGWYVSEGYADYYKNKPSKENRIPYYGIGIVNNNIAPIIDLLDRMEIPYNYCKQKPSGKTYTISISSRYLYNFMVDNCGKYAKNKRLPSWVFNLDSSHLKHLFYSLMEGDGTGDGNRKQYKYTTVSSQLALDFQRLCLHIGLKSHITIETKKYKGGFGKLPKYRVHAYNCNFHSNIFKPNIHQIDYDGDVHCITVKDNHTVLAGRNGQFEFTGQSGIWGRTLQVDFGEVAGAYFNPIFGNETEVGTRLEVARFILDNNLVDHVLSIAVDGILVDKEVIL